MPDFPVLTKQAKVDLQGAGVKAEITFARDCRVVAVGLVLRNASAVASEVEVKRRTTAGDVASETLIDTLIKPAEALQGRYLYLDLDQRAPGIELLAGDELVYETTVDPAEAQLAEIVVEYIDVPENRANLADGLESA